MNHKARRAPAHRENRSGPAKGQKTLFPDRWSWLEEYVIDDDQVKHFLRVLFYHLGEDHTECWPSLGTLAREMSVSKAVARKITRRAECDGLIVIKPPTRARKTNTYKPCIAEIRERARIEKSIRDRWNTNHDNCRENFEDYKAYLDHAKSRPTPIASDTPPLSPAIPHPSHQQEGAPIASDTPPLSLLIGNEDLTEDFTEDQSIEERTDGRTDGGFVDLPDLPARIFDPDTTPADLPGLLREWWHSDALTPARQSGVTAETLFGAILAARRHANDMPDAYMRRCLAQGVSEPYLREARQIIASARKAARPYSAH